MFQRSLPASTPQNPHEVNHDTRSAFESKKRVDPDDDLANIQEQDYEEHHLTLQTLLQGPSFVPKHPTLLSAIAGAGAGVIQGMAFTPIENIVR